MAGIYGDAPEKSKDLANQLGLITKLMKCPFMNAGEIVTSSPIDGVHWEADQHRCFAEALGRRIQTDFLRI